MEARASFNRPSVSKTFIAAILVLVAMGLGAMGGYVAKGLTSGDIATSQSQSVKAAPGTVLRQDNPAQSRDVSAAPFSVLRQDNPVQNDAQQGDTSTDPGLRGGHGQLP
jgi:hypothetical protein